MRERERERRELGGMDCNRDEAQRSKEIAEKRFMQKDYSGAHKFALKARRLFPQLEGVEQLVSVLDVHIHAASGHVDWYGILQSEPSADDALLRKQFRKLALMLHPDKNKSVGAESAFKLISEAWSVLSDKNKKMAYDMKRSSMGITKPAKPPSPPPPPPLPPSPCLPLTILLPLTNHGSFNFRLLLHPRLLPL